MESKSLFLIDPYLTNSAIESQTYWVIEDLQLQ